MTIDTKEFLPAAPKGSGNEEAMGRCAAIFFILGFRAANRTLDLSVAVCICRRAGYIRRLTCAVAVNHISELQGMSGGWPELAFGASEEQCTSG